MPDVIHHPPTALLERALSPDAATALQRRWETYCEAAFDFLAEEYPADLLRLIDQGQLAPTELTFAVESAGRIPDSVQVRQSLLPLLAHPDALVREGAIYGLVSHTDDAVRSELARLATVDPSLAVRHTASGSLIPPAVQATAVGNQ